MKKYSVFLNGLIWLCGLAFINWPSLNLSLGFFKTQDGTMLFGTISGTLINMILFYGNANYLLPKLIEVNKKRYLVQALILFCLLSSFETLVDIIYLQYVQPKQDFFENQDFIDGIFFNLIFLVWFFNFVFFLVSLGYGFSKIWVKNEKRQQKLKEEKLASELTFLKNQINPHFLFNTLNNLFGLSRRNGDLETSNQIAKLANLMRYMLYETNMDLVPLSKEIEYLHNFIELQKLRFDKNDEVHININWGNLESTYLIAPFILLPIIENAFKYGVSLQKYSCIEIHMKETEEALTLSVMNTFHNTVNRDLVGGIGLTNLKKRLLLLYPSKHTLLINEDKSTLLFNATLIINK